MIGFQQHGTMTCPGRHAEAFDALPGKVAALVDVTRGLFVHGDFLGLYSLDDTALSAQSRETLTVEKRLDRVFAGSLDPLTVARNPDCREVGTCRDYALMVCGMLRQKGIAARVRCGFARYFAADRLEDHWLCEYWLEHQARWARADAQLDDRHRDHLGITFDTCDLPDGEFVTAEEAWRLVRNDGFDPDLFGHGETAGEWFLWVNLARDYLSLGGKEVSSWDEWRQAVACRPVLSVVDRTTCEDIANRIRTVERNGPSDSSALDPWPFWVVGC